MVRRKKRMLVIAMAAAAVMISCCGSPVKKNTTVDQNAIVKNGSLDNKSESEETAITKEVTVPASVETTRGDIGNAPTYKKVEVMTEDKKEETSVQPSPERTDTDIKTKEKKYEKKDTFPEKSDTKVETNTNTDTHSTDTYSTDTHSTDTHIAASMNTDTFNDIQPSHTHNWEAVTKSVHYNAVTYQEPVYEQKWVEDTPAWDETMVVSNSYYKCNYCEFTTADVEIMGDHSIEEGYGYSFIPEQTQMVHHDATGHYEQVQTGTKTVTDQQAYDETVTIGYKCSICGATK
ncbi:hypothetical protein ACTQZS_02200 [Bilifractor sp. LCP19S3_H10]|uniref:hypothetical protein n=1 Tax=Bilifractor sp. LCP19S3_H10 TaxID=3438736 RepID=UPI003F8F2302